MANPTGMKPTRGHLLVDHVYKGLDGRTQAGDDYAARIYVIHDGGLFAWRTRAINYVWANSQPAAIGRMPLPIRR
jgi:hypothetical protein